MKKICLIIFACTVALCLLAPTFVAALEGSADNAKIGGEAANKSVTTSQNVRNIQILNVADASLTAVATPLANVEACNAQGKLWDGNVCVAPASGSASISTTAIMGETFYVYGTQASVQQTGSSSCCEWYFTPVCTCTAAQQMPTVVKYGSMLLIQQHGCINRGPWQDSLHVGKGNPSPWNTAQSIAESSYCYPIN